MRNEVITLHNIYRRLVLKEKEMDGRLNTCTCCNEKYVLTKSRIAVDNDHWSSSAYSTYCTQCVADTLGWQAEMKYMNARIQNPD